MTIIALEQVIMRQQMIEQRMRELEDERHLLASERRMIESRLPPLARYKARRRVEKNT